MTADITIPPEVEVAVAKAIFGPGGLSGGMREVHQHAARAAILAALEAWPGSYSLAENDSAVIRDVAAIILPLTEKPND